MLLSIAVAVAVRVSTLPIVRTAYAAQYMHEDARGANTGQRDSSKMLASELAGWESLRTH